MAASRTSGAAEVPKRRGRPRVIPAPDGVDTRLEILNAAGRLFTEVGFVKTSTRQIAQAVGIQQASLFHYFTRKIDILFALLDHVHEPPVSLVQWLRSLDASPEVTLYLLASLDTSNLCSMPNNLGLLYLQTDVASLPEFADYAEKRNQLRGTYVDLIARGRVSGQFEVDDVELTGYLVFGLVEGSCTWFHHVGTHTPEQAGRAVAESALRILMSNAEQLARVRSDAVELADSRPPPD